MASPPIDLFSDAQAIPLEFWKDPQLPAEDDHSVQADNLRKLHIVIERFKGRFDVYAQIVPATLKNEKPTYQPACANDHIPLLCRKPHITCGDCENKKPLKLTEDKLRKHLRGDLTLGIYPIKTDNTCDFIAIDFDKDGWREDVQAFRTTCQMFDLPVGIEISRSGKGAHAWFFFSESIPAIRARKLGFSLLALTSERLGDFKLASFDRIIPNQDELLREKDGTPKIGTLIALPLQFHRRQVGCSVFVDEQMNPYEDQFEYLDALGWLSFDDVERTIDSVTAFIGKDESNFLFNEKNLNKVMKANALFSEHLATKLPKSITVRIEDVIYIPRKLLPVTVQSKLRKTACFTNNLFFIRKSQGFNTWNTPRTIDCSSINDNDIMIPRGCKDEMMAIFDSYKIKVKVDDQRFSGHLIEFKYNSLLPLYTFQEPAFEAMLAHDIGVLHAGTAFGKTVIAANLIASRNTNTLIVVDSQLLFDQWQEALHNFSGADNNIGCFGCGKSEKHLTGDVDVAMIKSLCTEKGKKVLQRYGQIIVDECHRLGASTFVEMLNTAKARYIVGMSANDVRRDGRHPQIFMQCGPIRFSGEKPKSPQEVIVKLRRCHTSAMTKIDSAKDNRAQKKLESNTVIELLAQDEARTQQIVDETINACKLGRKVMILTARIKHRDQIARMLLEKLDNVFVLKSRTNTKQSNQEYADLMARINGLPFETPRTLVTTGRMGGTGFSHSPLDTMMLASPISYIHDIKQYKGRIDRTIDPSRQPWIYDFWDVNVDKANDYFALRKRAYKKLGYRLQDPEGQADLFDQEPLDPELDPAE
jgi:superfamily II DNA or RNA helicase